MENTKITLIHGLISSCPRTDHLIEALISSLRRTARSPNSICSICYDSDFVSSFSTHPNAPFTRLVICVTGLSKDTRTSWYNMSTNLEECESLYLKNCSCTAYTNADIREGGSGCILWFGELMDIKYYTDGEDMYVKMSSEFDYGMESKRSRVTKATVIVLTILATALLFLLLHSLRMRIQKKRGRTQFNSEMVALNKIEGEDFEVPLFDFTEIADATNNFSDHNKLGEGGFRPYHESPFRFSVTHPMCHVPAIQKKALTINYFSPQLFLSLLSLLLFRGEKKQQKKR